MGKRWAIRLIIVIVLAGICAFLTSWVLRFRTLHVLPYGNQFVLDFRKLYPYGDESVMYSTGIHHAPIWQSKVLIRQRYILTMQIPFVDGGYGSRRMGSPTFVLAEVDDVRILEGRVYISYGNSWVFGPERWREFVAQHGDLRVFDAEAMQKGGVPRLDQHWKGG